MELRDASDARRPADRRCQPSSNVPINDSNQGGVSARGDISSVNLRGLGSGNTLVLLNGRRVAAHGISSTEDGVPPMSVNVNTLPTRGLERVDILRDGASAVYGSDAVAGVINFVTDSSYVGNELQVQTGITEIGSGSDYRRHAHPRQLCLRQSAALDLDARLLRRARSWKTSRPAERRRLRQARARAPGFDAANGPFFDRNCFQRLSVVPYRRVALRRAT